MTEGFDRNQGRCKTSRFAAPLVCLSNNQIGGALIAHTKYPLVVYRANTLPRTVLYSLNPGENELLDTMLGAWVENGEYPADLETVGGLVRDICPTTPCAISASKAGAPRTRGTGKVP